MSWKIQPHSQTPCANRQAAWLFFTLFAAIFGITCSYYAGTDQAGEWRTFHPSLVLLPWMKPARSQKAHSIYHGPMHPKTPTWPDSQILDKTSNKNLANALLFTHTRSRATQSVVDSVDSEGNRIRQAFSGRRRPTKPKSSCPSETFNLCAIFSPVAHVYQTGETSRRTMRDMTDMSDSTYVVLISLDMSWS